MNKTLIGIFFIAFIFLFAIGYLTFTNKPQNTRVVPSPSPTGVVVTSAPFLIPSKIDGSTIPSQISAVQNFYDAYEMCMKTPPPAAEGRVTQYCIQHNEFGFTSLVNNLDKRGTTAAGGDPIYCAQNPPQSIKAQNFLTDADNNTIVNLIESYGPGEQRLQIKITLEDNKWKVSDVICPVSS